MVNKEEQPQDSKTIYLSDYTAHSKDCVLRLGTWDSYGIEQLRVIPGPGWEGLTITATFVTPSGSTRVLVPQDGLLTVPPEATAHPLPTGVKGKLVFAGVADGVQRVTANVLYLVTDHAPVEGEDSHPTPSEFAQFVAQVQQNANAAAQSATEAANSATEAAGRASDAAGSAAQAGQSAEKADKSAQDAAAELEKVQGAGSAALQAIGSAQSTAVDAVQAAQQTGVDAVQGAQSTATQAIEQARQNAVQAVGQASTTQVGAVNAAGQAQQTAIQQAAQTAVDDVQQAQETGVQAVQDAQTEAEEAITALVPDVYTKAENDARYAPIEAAIKVSGKGTGLASLSPTVPWQLQGQKIYGRSWQNGTPSVETEVPIQDSGQSGTVDVTVCGANLFNIDAAFSGWYSAVTGQLDNVFPLGSADNICLPMLPCGQGVHFTASTKSYFLFYDQNKKLLQVDSTSYSAVSPKGAKFFAFEVSVTKAAVLKKASTLMLNIGDTAQPYQPYTAQQLSIPTPEGLPGIPVNSGGNWTDETGQQWVSDVVNLAAGTKTQYCALEVLTGTPNFTETDDVAGGYWWRSCLKNTYKAGTFNALSNFGQFQSWGNPVSGKDIFAISQNHVYFSPSTAMTAEEINAKFAELIASDNPPVILGQLNTPITTPLEADTIAAYKALQSYPGTTNLLAPNCGIEATAVGDATQVIANINNKIAALESAATGI